MQRQARTLALWCGLALTLSVMTGCQKSKLKAIVAIANQQCPISMGAIGEATSITYNGETVEYKLSVDEKYVNVKAFNENPGQLQSTMKTMVQSPGGELKELVDQLIASDASLKFTYIGKTSGEQASCSMTAQELKTARDTKFTPEESAINKLESIVQATNNQLPMTVDEATTLTKLGMTDNDVIYYYDIDEEKCPIPDIEKRADAMKQAIVENLRANTASLAIMISSCVDCGKGIAYRYIGNKSGDHYDIRLTPDELAKI
jgi:hypothetical protein